MAADSGVVVVVSSVKGSDSGVAPSGPALDDGEEQAEMASAIAATAGVNREV
ncbi:MAG: hypothetical protein ACN4GZ_06885 [Acidimicrobiales bacterium]